MKHILIYALICAGLLSVPEVAAQDKQDDVKRDSIRRIAPEAAERRYAECLDFATSAPDRGIGLALAWQSEGGGVPARHCEAIGLFHLEEYMESAARLELIAEDARRGAGMPMKGEERLIANPSLASDLYGQAANAWLLANKLDEASEAIEKALSLVPEDSSRRLELLVDRARIAAADEDYGQSLKDLDEVLLHQPGRVDALMLSASAARLQGKHMVAWERLVQILDWKPDNPAALIERGHLHRDMGNSHLARQDWLKVIRAHPETLIGEEARAALEAMEVEALAKED